MCLGKKAQAAPAPAPPPEVLTQAAPIKKTQDASDLSIGTKKYRSKTAGKSSAEGGTQKYRLSGSSGVSTTPAPAGIAVNK